MATDKGALTLIQDLVEDLQLNEPVSKRKANTVTTAVGAAVTALFTGLTYWAESGTAAPDWLPFVVMIVGLLATTLGVSKTRNGVTPSLADKLQGELNKRIDLTHDHIDNFVDSSVGDEDLTKSANSLRETADSILNDLANRV